MAAVTPKKTRAGAGYANNNNPQVIPELYEEGGFLALSSLICHCFGMILRIYSTNVFGDMGNNYFACAYDLYLVILILTSYCLPGTISSMVSEAIISKHPKRAYKIFQAGLLFAIFIGGASALILYLGSGFLASTIMATPYAVFSLRVLCIAVFTCAINSVLRGFFQGMGTMVPSGISQLTEQIVKVVVGIASCSMLFAYGTTVGTVLADIPHYSAAFAANSIAYGIVVGSIFGIMVSVIFLVVYMRGFKRLMARDRKRGRDSMFSLIGSVVKAMVPFMLTALLPNAINLLTQGIFKKIGNLQGYTVDNLAVWWGIYAGKYKLLIALPVACAFAAVMSNASRVLESVQNNDRNLLQKQISKGVRYTMIPTIPCTIWLAVFLPQTISMLYPGTSSTNDLSVKICLTGVAGIVLFAFFTVTSAYLQLLGRRMEFIQNCLFALVLDILMMILLMLFLRLNIYAVVLSYMAYALVMCILNLVSLVGNFGYRQELMRTVLIPAGLSLISTAVSYGVYYMFYSSTENNLASTLIALFVAMGIYILLVLLTRCIRPEDLKDSAPGRMVLNFLRRAHIF